MKCTFLLHSNPFLYLVYWMNLLPMLKFVTTNWKYWFNELHRSSKCFPHISLFIQNNHQSYQKILWVYGSCQTQSDRQKWSKTLTLGLKTLILSLAINTISCFPWSVSSLQSLSRKTLPDIQAWITIVYQLLFQAKWCPTPKKMVWLMAPKTAQMIFLKTTLIVHYAKGFICILPILSHRIFKKTCTQRLILNKINGFHCFIKNILKKNQHWFYYKHMQCLLLSQVSLSWFMPRHSSFTPFAFA